MTTIVKPNDPNSNVVVNNMAPKKIIRHYDITEKREPEVNFAKTQSDVSEASLTSPTQKMPVNFTKSNRSEETVQEIAQEEIKPERSERRAAFKRAADIERRAMEMKRQAEQQLNEAKQFQVLMQEAKKDPTAVAKALGVDPNEFLRQYQNHMFNIKEDAPAPVKPEEEIKQRLDRYEQERHIERQRNAEIEVQTIRQTYVANKILPIITADTEKYQLLNMNGKEACAGFIYDLMNAHYQKTGEELSVQDVVEEMENQLTQEAESKLNEARKISKFSRHFREEQEQAEQQTLNSKSPALGQGPGRNQLPKQSQLTTTATAGGVRHPSGVATRSKTISDTLGGSGDLTVGERQRSAYLSREERLKRVINKLGY